MFVIFYQLHYFQKRILVLVTTVAGVKRRGHNPNRVKTDMTTLFPCRRVGGKPESEKTSEKEFFERELKKIAFLRRSETRSSHDHDHAAQT
jgi:hypothetical protein